MASRRCAASLRAFSRIFRAATTVAAPATGVDREAYVPRRPYSVSVSPCSILISDTWEAELLGDDLGERSLVALALRLNADPGEDLTGRVDADLAGPVHLQAEDVELMRRPGPDDLGERADAVLHQFAPLALLGLLPTQPGVVDDLHRLLQGAGVVAGVVLPACRRLVGELLRAG